MYARTTNSEATHPSFGPIKQLAAQISFMIPENIQLFGENMFGIHSIEYDKLDSYFYVFAALEDQTTWLSWDSIVELSDSLGIPTVPLIARRKVSYRNFAGIIFCSPYSLHHLMNYSHILSIK